MQSLSFPTVPNQRGNGKKKYRDSNGIKLSHLRDQRLITSFTPFLLSFSYCPCLLSVLLFQSFVENQQHIVVVWAPKPFKIIKNCLTINLPAANVMSDKF